MMNTSTVILSECLVPVVKALDIIHAKQENDRNSVKTLIGDTFKMMAFSITNINQARRDLLIKDVLPSYKTICSKSKTTSILLFGDKLKEDLKLAGEKTPCITTFSSRNKSPFLFSLKPKPSLQKTSRVTSQKAGTQTRRSTEPAETKSTTQEDTSAAKTVQGIDVNKILKLENTTDNFVAGKTENYVKNLTKLTSDRWVLNTITGYNVELSRHNTLAIVI